MATAPKPKGIGAGIKSLPKPALIGIPVAGALAFYLYQRRKSNTAATTAANAAATPAVDTGAATTGTADSGGGSGAIAQVQDFSSQIQALQGQASTEITDLDAIKSQQTQLLSTEEKDLSVDNKNLATSTKDLASDTADYSVDRQDLLTDNSGLSVPVKTSTSTTAPKKAVTPAPKLNKPMPTPKVTPAKIAPTKKTTYTAPRPAATVSGGRAPIKAPPKPVVKAPAKKK